MKTFLIIICVIGFFGSLANELWQNCLCYIAIVVFLWLCLPDKKNKNQQKPTKKINKYGRKN